MQHTTGVAVLATHLASTDRRALSEAWYGALHLAVSPAARGIGARPAPHAPGVAHVTSRSRRQPPSDPPAGSAGRRPVAARSHSEPHAEAAPERRASKSELTRTLERALLRRLPRAAQAQFALAAAGGRVQLLVRADGTRTRIVAVCAPALRERVERALAQARFALAARAVRVEAA
jgi:hypothetical protein